MSILCNPDPPLSVLQQLLHSHWAPRVSALQGLVSASPRFLLADVSIDSSVLAFCLLNSATKRCLTSIKPSEEHSSAAALTAGEVIGHWLLSSNFPPILHSDSLLFMSLVAILPNCMYTRYLIRVCSIAVPGIQANLGMYYKAT